MALAVSHGCLDVLQHHTICQLEKGVSVALWGLYMSEAAVFCQRLPGVQEGSIQQQHFQELQSCLQY